MTARSVIDVSPVLSIALTFPTRICVQRQFLCYFPQHLCPTSVLFSQTLAEKNPSNPPPSILYLVICQLACASLQQKMTSVFKFIFFKRGNDLMRGLKGSDSQGLFIFIHRNQLTLEEIRQKAWLQMNHATMAGTCCTDDRLNSL